MALYLLAPGDIQMPQQQARGRPIEVKLQVIEHGSSVHSWLAYAGSAWVGNLPNDENASEAALVLLLWAREKSRTWGIGLLGKLLAKVRLVRPCKVCGNPTADCGWFDPRTMEETGCVDACGREYRGVRFREAPFHSGEGGAL
jgi:hypothetical protein